MINNEKDIRLRFIEGFPETIRAVTRWDIKRDRYRIFISAEISAKQKAKSFRHELFHILNGDFQSEESVSEIEKGAHKALQ